MISLFEVPGKYLGVSDVKVAAVRSEVDDHRAVAGQKQGLALPIVEFAAVDAEFRPVQDVQVGLQVVRAGVGWAVPIVVLEEEQKKVDTQFVSSSDVRKIPEPTQNI